MPQVIEGIKGEVTLEGISGMVNIDDFNEADDENRLMLYRQEELKKGESGMASSSSSDDSGVQQEQIPEETYALKTLDQVNILESSELNTLNQ